MGVLEYMRGADTTPTVDVGDAMLPLVIRRHATARRMTLRLSPDGAEVRVTMPRWGRTADAIEFARTRTVWLTEQRARVPARQAVANGATVPFCGRLHRIDWSPKHGRKVQRDGGMLRLGGPEEAIAARLERWLRAEATVLMTADLAQYCARAALETPRLALSRANRRWGSCSAKGTVRINWRLVMAPDTVRRSVVAHEVAHLLHFDHSPAFHTALADLFEHDIEDANRWLKNEGRTLYSFFG
ncbi:MAG: SprT family zinc-dependent metalloprotease [Parerythrobacter sp.]